MKKTLKEIIGDRKNIDFIEFRCLWGDNFDDFIGGCRYKDKKLIPLDGDSYSLEEVFEKYKWEKDKNNKEYLVVWEDVRKEYPL